MYSLLPSAHFVLPLKWYMLYLGLNRLCPQIPVDYDIRCFLGRENIWLAQEQLRTTGWEHITLCQGQRQGVNEVTFILHANRGLLWLEPQKEYVAFNQRGMPVDTQWQPFCLHLEVRSKHIFPFFPPYSRRALGQMGDCFMQVVKDIPLSKCSLLPEKRMFSSLPSYGTLKAESQSRPGHKKSAIKV